MSIASDESERYYPNRYWPGHEPSDDYPAGKLRYLDGVTTQDLQEVYEIGRTAEPTDAEIRAAAIEMYHFEFPLHGVNITRERAAQAFDTMMPSLRDRFVGEARAALLAARKAVGE